MSTDHLIPCPVNGCAHQIDATPPEVPGNALAGVFGPGVFAAAAATQHAYRVEGELERHLKGHTVVDFVSTIADLRTERDAARAEVERLAAAIRDLRDRWQARAGLAEFADALDALLDDHFDATPAAEATPDEHPEHRCKRCGGPNITWSAPSPLWNEVMRGGDISGTDLHGGVVCPTCFAILAEQAGIAGRWRLDAEVVHRELTTVTPSGRVWDPERWLWVEATPAEPAPVDYKVEPLGDTGLDVIRRETETGEPGGALAVECPECHAAPGEACTVFGSDVERWPHSVRVKAASAGTDAAADGEVTR